ncbi:AMP-binding protein [Nonomuraea sediminis]|uniref:AMP-binding protein n=1 Tax=Nonomuraea sediminis TaxID=2835864 RepID=UPI00202A5A0F|nr:AMP-binding protein [Nonomuraea sediminis]
MSEEYRRNGWWRSETFLDDLKRHVATSPDKSVLISRRVADGVTDDITYAELDRLTDRIAHGLIRLGVRPGDFVAVQLPNRKETLPLTLACIKIGARIAPQMQLYRHRELDFMIRLTEARVFITLNTIGDLATAEMAMTLSQEIPALEHVVVIGGDGPLGSLDFDEHLLGDEPGDPQELEGRALGPDDPFLILFTSGTTGEPKGALHSQNTLYAAIKGYAEAYDLDDSLVIMTSQTSMHYVGLVMTYLTALTLGGTAVTADVWDPGLYLDLAVEHGVTLFYGSPPFARDISEEQAARPRALPSLRSFVSGSAPVPPILVERLNDTLGVRVYALWGMTENGGVTMTRPQDPPERAGESDGTVVDGMEVRVVDEDNRPVPTGEIGALQVRGAAQCLGYYLRDDIYGKSITPDGWFDTGDLARDDGYGGIRISGRTKDVIVAKGCFKIPVSDVEALLGRHGAIRDVALIGIPDPTLIELVCVVVTPSGQPPTLEDLRTYMKEAGVNETFWPERLELIDAMPRTATGKIRKVELRERFGVASG